MLPMVPRMVQRTPARMFARARLGLSPLREGHGAQARAFGPAGDSAALGDRPSLDLLDVAGEIDRGRSADVRPHGERIDRGARLAKEPDSLRRQATRHDDPDVGVAGLVEPGTDLVDEVRRDAAALARRVEANAVQ